MGPVQFKENIIPFLKGLITNSQMNVSPNGTHVGIITFSTQRKTMVLLAMGELRTKKRLREYLDNLKYDEVGGAGTRIGMALKMADEVK